MALGCLICDEVLDGPAPGLAEDASATDQPKKPRSRSKKPALPAPTETDLVVSPCGHMFHEVCISKWFKNKSTATCPVCRKNCTRSRLLRLYPSRIDAYDDSLSVPTSTSTSSTKTGKKTDSQDISVVGSNNREENRPSQSQLPVPTPLNAPNEYQKYGTFGILPSSANFNGIPGSRAIFNYASESRNNDNLFGSTRQVNGSGPSGASVALNFSNAVASTAPTTSVMSANANMAPFNSTNYNRPWTNLPAFHFGSAPLHPPNLVAPDMTTFNPQLIDFTSSPTYASSGLSSSSSDLSTPGSSSSSASASSGSSFSSSLTQLNNNNTDGDSTNGVHRHKYTELKELHKFLMADYTELQQKYNDVRDENALLKVQLESSDEEIKKLRQNCSASSEPSAPSPKPGPICTSTIQTAYPPPPRKRHYARTNFANGSPHEDSSTKRPHMNNTSTSNKTTSVPVPLTTTTTEFKTFTATTSTAMPFLPFHEQYKANLQRFLFNDTSNKRGTTSSGTLLHGAHQYHQSGSSSLNRIPLQPPNNATSNSSSNSTSSLGSPKFPHNVQFKFNT